MTTFIVLTAILAVTQALSLSEVEEQQWENFKLIYSKEYKDEHEENMRKEIYADKLHKFQEHNKKYEAGVVSYTVGVNQFTDMTHEEFVRTLAPINVTAASRGLPFVPQPNVEVPSSIDWREKGAVTSVTSRPCGGCYTSSALGALEGQLAIKKNQRVILSAQNLIDCSSKYGNRGCEGTPTACFEYILANGGIETQLSYYFDFNEGEVGPCHYKPENSAAKIDGFVILPRGDEDALLTAVGTVGPVSVVINAVAIQVYTGGVFSGDCDPTNINQAVLVVGYGTTPGGQDYWIVRNCWGQQYGEQGYVRLARNKNQCGITMEAIYPVV